MGDLRTFGGVDIGGKEHEHGGQNKEQRYDNPLERHVGVGLWRSLCSCKSGGSGTAILKDEHLAPTYSDLTSLGACAFRL